MTKLTWISFPLLVSAALLSVGGCAGDEGSQARPFIDAPPVCCPAAPDDWPQYRGPARDGSAPQEIGPWPEDGPREVWRRPIGDGFASLAVKGDRLFTSAVDQQEEVLFCLDAGTGGEVWRLAMGPEFTEEYGNGPRSTPTVDDRGVVYALSSRAVLFAVDSRDGTLIWSRDLYRQFGGRDYDRGYASSPLVEGELVILNVGPKDGSVVALERTRGDLVWSSQSGAAAFSSPVAVTLDGRRQIVTAVGRGLVALDPQDGSLLWEHEWKTKYGLNIAMPVEVPEGRIFLSSGYDQGAVLLDVAEDGGRWRAEPLWTQRLFRNHFSTSVYRDGLLFGFDDSILKCLDAETGEPRWSSRGYGKGSLVRLGDTLLVLSEDGEVGLVRATGESFQELARAKVLNGRCWTAPAVAAGRLYVRNGSEIVCLDLGATGAPAAGAAGL